MMKYLISLLLLLYSLSSFSIENGNHDETSPFLNLNQDFEEFSEWVEAENVILKFANALYYNSAFLPDDPRARQAHHNKRALEFMLPGKYKEIATFLSLDVLISKLKEQNLKLEEAINFNSPFAGLVHISNKKNWYATVYVDKEGSRTGDYFTPYPIIALHELEHIKRLRFGYKRPSIITRTFRVINEIGPTLELIIQLDNLMKRVTETPMEEVYNYPVSIPSNKNYLNIGEVANIFRNLKEIYGTYEKALMGPEAERFISHYFNN